MTSADSATPTRREQLKQQRRDQLLTAGARLIAERGYLGMRLDDLGAAVGISGPAVYRHFPNKEALLIELLVGISRRLLEGGTAVATDSSDPAQALAALVDFHLDFALGDPELISIQDRDLDNVPPSARHEIRRTQRRYVEIWVRVLCDLTPELDEDTARIQAHAVFGLLNSTPHSAGPTRDRTRPVLRSMALAALTGPLPDRGGEVACDADFEHSDRHGAE